MAESSKTLREKLARATNRLKKGKEKATEMVTTLLNTGEVVGTSFGFSYARGRFGEAGELNVAGIPMGLAAGLVGHLLAFAGFFGRQSEHVHAVSNGAIAEYTANIGYRLGSESGGAVQGYRRVAGSRRRPAGLGRGSYQAWGQPTMFSRAAGARAQ